jgi:ATP-dependent 26S proteasome regulatory subunit
MTKLMDPSEYLSVELQRLDLLLHREILRLRAGYQLSVDEFRGLYISDEQVNQLIDRALNYEGATSTTEELTSRAEALRAANLNQCDDSPWRRLSHEFSLSPLEQDILLLAVAPEIDLKYETLYGYLNNDITRKWPTCDLAMRLFAGNAEGKLDVRRYLMPQLTLFSSGLLQPLPSIPTRPTWLATGFSAAPMVSHYLSGVAGLDPHLTPFVELRTPAIEWERLPLTVDQRAALQHWLNHHARSSAAMPVFVFTGRAGTGRVATAEAVCGELGLPLLRVDLDLLRAAGENIGRLTQALRLQQRVQGAGLYLAPGEALFEKEGKPLPDAQRFIKTLMPANGPVFITCEPGTPWRELLSGHRAFCLHFDTPDYVARLKLWGDALAPTDASLAQAELEALADRFGFTPGQINSAVVAAFDAQALFGQSLDSASLFEAARAQSDQKLSNLAVKVKTIHTWEDLVLPRRALQRVKEVAAAIKYRHIVYSEWGFEQRIASGKGLKALFTGASGTGKTMTASVIARELGLDLYKIDLSGIVSKYIGETEKNLDRIFQAAQCSNAILFFDEADALFGKRSEVKDAHDRYANIEVAYLLQKVEEYEGVVILASNLSKNIDEGFSRRMHYVVEFPMPDETQREQLWHGMFPPQAPLGGDIDLQFLARQFSIAGGDIRNVALDAAFLAAQDGQVVTMKQLVKAMARQMMKQGRIPSATDFKQYHAFITHGE